MPPDQARIAVQQQRSTFHLDRFRWVNLALSGFILFATGVSYTGTAALVNLVGKDYGLGFANANLNLVDLYGIIQVLLGIPAGITCDRLGF